MDITLIVKASNQQFDDQTIKCASSWTIRRLKGHLNQVYPGKPSTDEQKLIYSGQLLSDSVVLKDILRHYDGQQAHTVHLVFTPKNNRQRDFNSGGTSASSSSSTMPPKSSNDSGATATSVPASSRMESTRLPETGISSSSSSSSFGADGLRQRNVTGAVPTTMAANPIPPASADYIMGQQLAMQNWMQQAYMQYLNQYMNVISNGQTPQTLYASAPTNPSIPQSSPQTNVAQPANQPSQTPVLAQTLPNLAYYPYLSTMSSSPMPSASSIPAPISSSGTIPTSPSSATPGVTPGPSSQPTIPGVPVASPAASAGPSPSGSSASSPAPTVASTGTVQQDASSSAQAAAPAAAEPVPAVGAAAAAAAPAPARRFPNIVVEEQENRDWLDIFFSLCRVGILITVVYLYSSPARCIAVFFVGVMLYLYQMGFFRNDRADRMEFARRLVVQQINMAHVIRQRAEQARAARAPVAPAPAAPAPAAAAAAATGEAGAANAQTPVASSSSAAGASAAPTPAQNDETDNGPKTTTTPENDSPQAQQQAAQPQEGEMVTESAAAATAVGEEVVADPSTSAAAPEVQRVNINDVAAFLRTMVLSFITSIIPDTPAA